MADAPFQFTTPTRPERYLKALFYGPYGAGKTHLAGSAEDCEHFRDVLFIDSESGDMTLEAEWPNMVVVPIHDYSQIARLYEFLTVHHRLWRENKVDKVLEHENMYRGDKPLDKPHHFKTVVIDSLSELQGFLHYDIMDIHLGVTKLDEELTKAGWDEFDISINKMRLVVRSFRDLPMNVILIAGEQEKTDNGRIRLSPNFQGKLSLELPGFMDVVGRLEAGEPNEKGMITRRLFLSNGKNWKAKSRLSTLKAPYLDNPTMESIAKAAKLI